MKIPIVKKAAPLFKSEEGFLMKQKGKGLKNIQRSINGKTVNVSHPRANVDNSVPILENVESENEERNKRPGNQRTKRPSRFMVALKNANLQQPKLHLVNLGKYDTYHKWFETSSAAGHAKPCKINICETIKCTCEYFSQKNTPCKHIYLYSMCQKILIYCSRCILQ